LNAKGITEIAQFLSFCDITVHLALLLLFRI
jgi:hypothetical protein